MRAKTAGNVKIRRIRADEGPRLRALRLRALADAPAAFGSTLAEAAARTAEEWAAQARQTAASATAVMFVAEARGGWCGMAGGFVHRDYPDTVRLVSMWVDPARRRAGVGGALVDAIVDWAGGRGAKCVQLWVTETNAAARSLYARRGFAASGPTKPLPSDPARREVLLVRELSS